MAALEESTSKDYLDNLDHSILQTPLNIRLKNVQQILTAISVGTDEVKNILTNECNIIFECKVCNNLFRCFANFLAHKRFYCKNLSGVETIAKNNDLETMVVQPAQEDLIMQTQCLSTEDEFAGYQTQKNIISVTSNPIDNPRWVYETEPTETIMQLDKIPSNPNAVFQAVKLEPSPRAEKTKPCSVQIDKFESSASKYSSFTSKKDKLAKRSDCNVKTMQCLKCNISFLNIRTMFYHMLNRHTSNGIRYPCPFCNTTFVQIYGVYRHMIRIHHKSREQAHRLRANIMKMRLMKRAVACSQTAENSEESNKKMVFKCNKCQREFDRKSSQMSHERFCGHLPIKCKKCRKSFGTKASQADHEKFCGRKPIFKCSNCQRAFERKCSQLSHEKFCGQKNINKERKRCFKCGKVFLGISCGCACKNRRVLTQPVQIKAEIKVLPKDVPVLSEGMTPLPKTPLPRPPQLRAIYRLESTVTTTDLNVTNDVNAVEMEVCENPIPIKKVSPQQVRPAPSRVSSPELPSLRPRRCTGKKEDKDFVDSQTLKWRSANKVESVGMNSDQPKHVYVDTPIPDKILKSITELMNEKNKSCIKCHRKFSSYSNLRRHVATHIGYNRYKCKLCTYVSFYRSDCRLHIERAHPEKSNDVDNQTLSIHSLNEGSSSKPSIKQETMGSKLPFIIHSQKANSLHLIKKSPPGLKAVRPPTFRIDSLRKAEVPVRVSQVSPKKSMPDLELMEIKHVKEEPKVPKTVTTTKPIIITTLFKKGVTALRVNNKVKSLDSISPDKKMPKLSAPIKVEPFHDTSIKVVNIEESCEDAFSAMPQMVKKDLPTKSLAEIIKNGDIDGLANKQTSVPLDPSLSGDKDQLTASILVPVFTTLVTRSGTYKKIIGLTETVNTDSLNT